MVEASLNCDIHDLFRYCVCLDENESCMMGQCKECPVHQGLIDYLSQCDELSDVEEITYKQWVSTDRTKLINVVESKDDFIENLASQIEKLLHSKISKPIHENT